MPVEEQTVHVAVQIVLVALGSALGGLTRWGVAVAFGRLFGTGFPWGTFFINVSGCLFLGWFMTVLSERLPPAWISGDNLKLMVAVGFTGAYTTFSTFEYEAHGLVEKGDGLLSLAYVFGSLFLGFLGVWLGVRLARIH